MRRIKCEEALLPQYLNPLSETGRFYGTIEKKEDRWIIEAEPQAMELIRRVFKSTVSESAGKAILPNNKRLNGEINWFMMRYPLKITNKKTWQEEIKKTAEFYREKLINNYKINFRTEPINFKGKLLEFQKQGTEFLLRNRHCLLADEMGLGKTPQSIAFLAQDNKFPTLIVVPPHLLGQWENEIKKFLGNEPSIHIIQGLRPYRLPKADIYLIHYLILRGWFKDLKNMRFDTIIFDEAQEMRHSESQKYYGCMQISETATNLIGLSGTPIYNYGVEMFNVMNVIERGCLGDRQYFVKEWCSPCDNRIIEKPEAFGKYLLEEGLLMRRRKDEVLKELPEKRRAIQKIEIESELYIELITDAVQAAQRIPLAKDDERAALLLSAVNDCRRVTGIAKSLHVAKFVEFLVDSGEPVILFAFHHAVIDLYLKHLQKFNPLCVTGRENKEQKENNIKDFMEGKTNLLIVNLRTTSGLNLQRARCVVFGELDWSPAVHTQAEDRVHRIGQKDSVLSYYLVAETPSDQEISSCLGLKREQFETIMQDKPETPEHQMISQTHAQKFMWEIVQKLQTGGDNK